MEANNVSFVVKTGIKKRKNLFYREGQNAVVCSGLAIKFTLPSSDKMQGDNLWKMEAQLYVVFCLVFSFSQCWLIKTYFWPVAVSTFPLLYKLTILSETHFKIIILYQRVSKALSIIQEELVEVSGRCKLCSYKPEGNTYAQPSNNERHCK